MALTADQNAALQLILEREQSYGDLAALLGVDEAEVRSRARAALTELGGADPDRNVGMTDYLLGQADPIGRADVVRHLRDDINDHRLARELVETLRRDVPGRRACRAFPARRGRRSGARSASPHRPPASRPPSPTGAGRTISLSDRQTRMIAAMSAGAVLLIVVVLGVAGVFSGDDDSSTPAASSTSADSTTATVRRRGAREHPARRPGRRRRRPAPPTSASRPATRPTSTSSV